MLCWRRWYAEPEVATPVLARSPCRGWLAVPAGRPSTCDLLFKHALVQDAAYGTLLREPTTRVARTYRQGSGNPVPRYRESQPELLARHCTEAGPDREGRRSYGAKRDSAHLGALPWLKLPSSSHAPSAISRLLPVTPRSVANR